MTREVNQNLHMEGKEAVFFTAEGLKLISLFTVDWLELDGSTP